MVSDRIFFIFRHADIQGFVKEPYFSNVYFWHICWQFEGFICGSSHESYPILPYPIPIPSLTFFFSIEFRGLQLDLICITIMTPENVCGSDIKNEHTKETFSFETHECTGDPPCFKTVTSPAIRNGQEFSLNESLPSSRAQHWDRARSQGLEEVLERSLQHSNGKVGNPFEFSTKRVWERKYGFLKWRSLCLWNL